MSIASVVSAQILSCSMLLNVSLETPDRPEYGVWDWLSGVNSRKKAFITVGSTNYRLKFIGTIIKGNFSPVNVAWTAATKTLTGTGAFANYRSPHNPSDTVLLLDIYGNDRFIASRDSDDQITLVDSISGSDIAATPIISMEPKQCKKLSITAQFMIVDEVGQPVRIAPSATGVTLTLDALALSDYLGNTNEGVSNFSVTNNAVIGPSGFIETSYFGAADTLYVAPGHASASDARTFDAAKNNTSTPFATLTGAEAACHNAGKNGTAVNVLILEGTTHTLTAFTQLRCGGASRLSPHFIGTYWDGSAGVGTEGVRPTIVLTATNLLVSQGGGGSPLQVNYLYIQGITIDGNDVAAAFACNLNSHLVLDDIICKNSFGGGCQLGTSAVPVLDNVLLNRVTQVDGGTTSGHSNFFFQAVDNLQIIECIADFVGRKNTNKSGLDIFSRSWYLSTTVTRAYFAGLWISRSDGIQCRGNGNIYASAFENVCMFNFIGRSGAIRFTSNRSGGNVTTQAEFSGATYTHATRNLALTNIGSGFVSGSAVIISGSGLPSNKVKKEIRVSGVSTNSLTLMGDGLGSDCTNVVGAKLNAGRGFGPTNATSSDTILFEGNLLDELSLIGSDPLTITLGPSSTGLYRPGTEFIFRNNMGIRSGPWRLSSNTGTTTARAVRNREVIDTRNQSIANSRATTSVFSITGWSSFFNSDYNLFFSDSTGTLAQVGGSVLSLSGWRSTTSGDFNSSDNSTGLLYKSESKTWEDWFSRFGTTLDGWYDYIRTRPLKTWPSQANMHKASAYLAGQKMLTNKGRANLANPVMNFYGPGNGQDPAIFASLNGSARVDGPYDPFTVATGLVGGSRWNSSWASLSELLVPDDDGVTSCSYNNASGIPPTQNSPEFYCRDFGLPSMSGRTLTALKARCRLRLGQSSGSMTFLTKLSFVSNTTELAVLANPLSSGDQLGGLAGSKYTSLTDVDINISDASTLNAISPYLSDSSFGIKGYVSCVPDSSPGPYIGDVYIDNIRIISLESTENSIISDQGLGFGKSEFNVLGLEFAQMKYMRRV